MKRALSLLLLAFPLWLGAQSPLQEQTAYLNLPGTVQKTITREWKFPTPITYVETDTKHYFVHYIGGNSSATVVEINPNITVNDFVVDMDSVFMCGTTASGDGFFGFFGINDFFFGSHAYKTVTGFNLNVSTGCVSTFDKMVSYLYGGERRFAAIGRTSQGTYVTTEMRYFSSTNTAIFRADELPASYGESLLDIALTQNYVITAGYRMQGGVSMPCFRVYDKSSLFSSPGTFNERTVFMPYSSPIGDFDGSQLLLTHISGDDFTIAAFWKTSPAANIGGTYLGRYQVNNNILADYVSSTYISQTSYNGGWKLQDLTRYDASNLNLYLLENAVNAVSGQSESMIFELYISSFSYVTNIFYRVLTSSILQSIDANSTTAGYVSNGITANGPHELWYNMGKVSNYSCVANLSENSSLTSMNAQTEPYPFVHNWGNPQSIQTNNGTATQVSVVTMCIN